MNCIITYMNYTVRKRIFGHVRPAKIQISLRICAVWSDSSLGAFGIAKYAKFLHADNEDSDQTARMRRLIWVFLLAHTPEVLMVGIVLLLTHFSHFLFSQIKKDVCLVALHPLKSACYI